MTYKELKLQLSVERRRLTCLQKRLDDLRATARLLRRREAESVIMWARRWKNFGSQWNEGQLRRAVTRFEGRRKA